MGGVSLLSLKDFCPEMSFPRSQCGSGSGQVVLCLGTLSVNQSASLPSRGKGNTKSAHASEIFTYCSGDKQTSHQKLCL